MLKNNSNCNHSPHEPPLSTLRKPGTIRHARPTQLEELLKERNRLKRCITRQKSINAGIREVTAKMETAHKKQVWEMEFRVGNLEKKYEQYEREI